MIFFFEIFLKYVKKYKEEILNNQGKIPLIVKYEDTTKVECDSNFIQNTANQLNKRLK